jgi:hypothetical protein
MAKKKAAKKVKRAKSPKREKTAKISQPPDAEWAFVEERYSNLSVDFNSLARELGATGL